MRIPISKKIAGVFLATVVAVAGLAGAMASPASAEGWYKARHGKDIAYSYGTNYGVAVCDNEDDGRSVYAETSHTRHQVYNDIAWDSYGNGCTVVDYSVQIRKIRFCEVGNGCSRWRTINSGW